MSHPNKIHLALNSADVPRAVTFYSASFGRDPVKHKPGYAKFDIDDPPLNLTLNAATGASAQHNAAGAVNHLGIQVAGSDAVTEAAQRLTEAGLATWEERDTDCCYALQDKVWVSDPDGHRWEVFVVKQGDTAPEKELAAGAACDPVAGDLAASDAAAGEARACC